MKKYIFLLLIVSIAISCVACNSNNNGLPEYSEACAISYRFSSIKDMHTYISTGSTNADDYSELPNPSFDIFPDNKRLLEQGYKSIHEYFEFDENDYEDTEAYFTVSDLSGKFEYVYAMDNVMIIIQPAVGDNIVECYSKERNKDFSKKDFSTFESEVKIAKGQMLRENNDFEVIYRVESGLVKEACFLIGNMYIRIGIIMSRENKTDFEAYQAFNKEEKYEPFAKFFSDDDEVVKNAFENIKQNLEAAS
jgi:hypothetical protein